MTEQNSSKLLSFEKKGIPLVVIGLPQAGKTSFVNRLKTGDFAETSPTMGMQFEHAEIGDVRFDIFDLGGHETYRKTIWQTYIKLAYGIVFIIDSSDPASFEEAKEEFWKSIDVKDDQDEFLILFLCNKTDLKKSVDLERIINQLELYKLAEKENASFQFFKTSMKTGENVDNAVSWLRKDTANLVAKRKINPLMLMIADIEGFPILEIDKIGLKEDPTLLSGFLAAIESFSQRLFGRRGLLQYMASGGYKYIIKTDDEYIYSMIILQEECQEEARRLLDLISNYMAELKVFALLEGVIVQTLGINLTDYILKRGYK